MTKRWRREVPLAPIAVLTTIVIPFVLWPVVSDRSATPDKPLASQSAPSLSRPTPAAQPAATTACTTTGAIAKWPLEQRLAQLLMVGAEPNNARQILSRYQLGGIFINGDTTSEVSADGATRFNSFTRIPPFVAIDEEGGRIQRIPQLVGSIPSARVMAQTMTPPQVEALALARGQALRRYGFTMDFAPVADVSAQRDDGVIGDRSFSSDPAVVIRYAGAFAAGLRQAGIIPVLKHFPGHGHATGDSHAQIAVTPNLANLEQSDLLPYKSLLNSKPVGVMIGHLKVPGLTSAQQPTSINAAAINGLLRSQLAFKGFVVTDDLETMVAITKSHRLPDATLEALRAGATMALSKSNDQVSRVLATLTAAVKSHTLAEKTVDSDVAQILNLKGVDPCTPAPSP